ncbi:MAG: hypothetical protein MJ177_00440 [Clostridia bacterium]|nr:hypothetical protein [Clostridia bacterium]
MNRLSEFFLSIDEPYAAALFEHEEKGYFYRHCAAYAKWFDCAEPPEYQKGELLYPCGDRYFRNNYDRRAVKPQYALTYEVDDALLKKKCEQTGNITAYEKMHAFREKSCHIYGWTHGSPNYKRIVKEGLASYRDRIAARKCETAEDAEFREGLLMLTDAMSRFAARCREYLLSVSAPAVLTDALKQVPFYPARSFYEGLVCWNTVFYFDGCDNLGCLDAGLEHLYNGEDMTGVIGQLFSNMDSVGMWSCAIGPGYNEITRQALVAIRGKRRPLLELRVRENMPDDLWVLAYEGLMSGCTHPSFYNDKAIHDMLHTRFPYIPEEDLSRFCGGGCTETNLEGLTHAGGTDFDVNLLKIFEEYMKENLSKKESFEAFFEGMCAAAVEETARELDKIDEIYRYRSIYLPHPMRTMLFDDCIDKGRDYNNGGTRYSWTMNSESGLINVIDSLSAVKKLYYTEKKYTAQEFISLLAAEDEQFFRELKKCPCFGTDDEETDLMGAEFARRVFTVYREKKPKLEFLDGFTLTEHQFTRYEGTGACVGATPDGRHCGQPTCDSMAAVRGKAVQGPTAMLRSAARLPQNLVDGISVVNLTLSKSTFSSPAVLRGLVEGYFAMGGIQLQITLTSEEELLDALENPDQHGDLIVRVGGFSEYFVRLSPALRQAIVERDVHGTM